MSWARSTRSSCCPAAAASRGAEIASGYAGSLTLGAGQFCTNPGLLFVPEDAAALQSTVADAVSAASGGPMLSERIYKGYEASLAEIEAHPAVTAVAAGTTGEGPWGAIPAAVLHQPGRFRRRHPGPVPGAVRPAGLMISYPSAGDLLPGAGPARR